MGVCVKIIKPKSLDHYMYSCTAVQLYNCTAAGAKEKVTQSGHLATSHQETSGIEPP